MTEPTLTETLTEIVKTLRAEGIIWAKGCRESGVDDILSAVKAHLTAHKPEVIGATKRNKINDEMPPDAKYGDVFEKIAQAQLNDTYNKMIESLGE